MSLQEIISDIPKLLAYLICIGCLFQLFIIFFLERNNILTGLRGKDRIWQFLELSGICWLVIFPVVVICSLLGLHVETGVWTTLDAVYLVNVGGKIGNNWIDSNAKNKPQHINHENEGENTP